MSKVLELREKRMGEGKTGRKRSSRSSRIP